MVGRVAPGLIVDPGPAPRLYVRPMARSVRLPAGGYRAWSPDVAVLAVVAPAAIGTEILVAGDTARQVLRRRRVAHLFVARIPIGCGRGRRAVDGAQLEHRRVAGDF